VPRYTPQQIQAGGKANGIEAVHVHDPPGRFDGPADRTVVGDVVVRYHPDAVRRADIAGAVNKAGFNASIR
jgi:hypothetical protein